MQTPQTRHGLGVDEFEDAALTIRPLDEARTVVAVLEQLEQELPQVRAAFPPLATAGLVVYAEQLCTAVRILRLPTCSTTSTPLSQTHVTTRTHTQTANAHAYTTCATHTRPSYELLL